ncbi:MAG: CRISPR-associated endonuclease Cas1 [Candidatus Nezhaarchaeota archaeon]|nr:CRISPR-associated endonuclease Cas1 [Candidatus Nezhaarchaeota archaeon]MCX8142557.1 CRISPR-associated endonuclease Cas1 [Candidatus Nezhaarchaeota archaeon]
MIVVVKGAAKVSKRGSTIAISTPKKDEGGGITWETQSVPLLDVELLVVVGSRVRLSSGALLMLSEADVPVLIHGRRSDCFLLNPFSVRVAEARRKLYRAADNVEWRINVGRAFIDSKLQGFINLIRYLAYKEAERGMDTKWILEELKRCEMLREIEGKGIKNVDELRNHEGKWSKKLWELLATFVPSEYEFTGRDPKSRDPINSATSYTYAIVYGLCTHALIASGLDPYVGIVHSERAGKTSLTYDFSEMFKPVAIHAVIIASRTTKLSVDKNEHLTKESLETVTRLLYKALKRRHRSWKHSVKGEIYAKAWELRQSIERGTPFRPFTYTVK